LGYEAIGEMMASAAGKEGDFRTASGGLADASDGDIDDASCLDGSRREAGPA
jgi:hypothetical protein